MTSSTSDAFDLLLPYTILDSQEITQLCDGDIQLALLPGDGIGRDVSKAVLHIINRINERYDDLIGIQLVPSGAEYFQKTGLDIAAGGMEACRDADVILLGAAGLPDTNGQQIEMPNGRFAGWSPLVGNRRELDLYANVRPVKTYPGLTTRISGRYHRNLWPDDVNLVIVRENTEDLYCGIGGIFERANDPELAIDVRLTTVKGVERIANFAFQLALDRHKMSKGERQPKVSCISKTNVLKGCKLFASVFNSVAQHYPEVETDHMLVDAFAQCVLRKPEIFDVVVTSNMFGDIVTEVASVVQGGLGFAVGCNIGDNHAMFEPIHGSAPNLAGKGKCNPIAMIAALSEALRWLGEAEKIPAALEASADINSAIATVILKGRALTYDACSGSPSSTDEVARAIADAI